jgi:hypothetical protein
MSGKAIGKISKKEEKRKERKGGQGPKRGQADLLTVFVLNTP